MNLALVGSGMYSIGSGKSDYGIILPSIFEYHSKNKINKLFIINRSVSKKNIINKKISNYSHQRGITINFEIKSLGKKNFQIKLKKYFNKVKPLACIIAIPDDYHFEIAIICLKLKIHLLVVKPLTPSKNESMYLCKLAKKNNVLGMVEFHKRFDRHNIILRDLFNSGKLGSPLYSLAEYSQKKSIPSKFFRKWSNTTNIFQYLGVHYVDIIRFVTRAVPIRVLANGQKSWLIKNKFNNYDSIQASIDWKLENGTIFNQMILVNWIDPETTTAISDQKIKFICTKGRYESDQKNRGISIIIDNINPINPNPDFCYPYYNDKNKLTYKGYGIDSVVNFLELVFKLYNKNISLNKINSFYPTFDEAVYSSAVIEAVNKSLANNQKWVSIKVNE